jgi:neurotransmitter:Na+ symporter, NSS family
MERFGSRYALVAAGITMAVGTGNLWRFPRVAAEWGGGTFLIILVLASVLWAVPLLIAESLLGSKSRLGTVGAFRDFMGRRFAWMGAFMALVTIGIMFYYAVVCGWALYYFGYSLTGNFTDPTLDTQAVWDDFTGTPALTVAMQLLALLIVAVIIVRGLKRGFEGVLMVALPALFIILIILAVRALTLPDSAAGLSYLFTVDIADFGEARIWLEAFTQIAFSTGAGWGLYLTYSVYARKREDMAGNSVILTAGDLLAGLLAGITVLCTLFALASVAFAEEALGDPGVAGQGVSFIYLPPLFSEMPGGMIFAPLFFFAVALAGLSSLIAMVELTTRNVVDMGVRRSVAVVAIVVVAFLVGLPSALNLDYFANQDFVWGVGLLLSGLFAAIAIMKYGVQRARAEVVSTASFPVGGWFAWCIRLFPVMFAAVMGFWVYQAVFIFAPDDWWNPLSPFSLATLLVQWAVVAAVVLALNNFLANRVGAGPMSGAPDPDAEEPKARESG